MATVQAPSTAEQRFRLSGVDWQSYLKISDGFGERPVRVTYDRGELELMTLSYDHESSSAVIGRLISVLGMVLRIPIKAGKSTTFRREDMGRGLEPDECFYIQNAVRILGRTEIDLTEDPPPDLAVEVEVSHSVLDRMGIYAALGVPELWRYDGTGLRVYHLIAGKGYDLRDRSLCFPFLPLMEFAAFIPQGQTLDDSTLLIGFSDWLRDHVLPNLPPAAGD
jgi:Uma2 family endonuclease